MVSVDKYFDLCKHVEPTPLLIDHACYKEFFACYAFPQGPSALSAVLGIPPAPPPPQKFIQMTLSGTASVCFLNCTNQNPPKSSEYVWVIQTLNHVLVLHACSEWQHYSSHLLNQYDHGRPVVVQPCVACFDAHYISSFLVSLSLQIWLSSSDVSVHHHHREQH